MRRRHDPCPACGTSGQTEGLYCHVCGGEVTYEDEAADRRERAVRAVRGRLAYVFDALLAVALLVCLPIVLLWFWGNRAQGSTVVPFGVAALFEAEEQSVPLRGALLEVPRWPPRGPVTLSFRYALAPPGCVLRLRVLAAAGSPARFETTAPASFLLGEARMVLPPDALTGPPPLSLQLLQDEKPVSTFTLTPTGGGPP